MNQGEKPNSPEGSELKERGVENYSFDTTSNTEVEGGVGELAYEIGQNILAALKKYYGEEKITSGIDYTVSFFISEAYPNALLHGNYGLEGKSAERWNDARAMYKAKPEFYDNLKIPIKLKMGLKGFTLTVEDFGKGFDMDSAPDMFAEENKLKESGRGLGIVASLAEKNGFGLKVVNKQKEGPNLNGTVVILEKKFNSEI